MSSVGKSTLELFAATLALITCLPSSEVSPQALLPKSGRPHSANAGNYYVAPGGSDNKDGSTSHPWRTIQRAASVVTAGATVHVAPGSYPGGITSMASGTATARIRFLSDTQWGAKIHSTDSEFVWSNKGDYVDIEGFDLSGDTVARIGVLNWASSVRVMNNRVHDIPAPGCTSAGGGGIDHASYTSTSNDTLGNWVYNIGDYSHPCPRVHGIYHSMTGGMIANNVVYRAQAWGISLGHYAKQVTISSNTIFNNAYGGIVVSAPSDRSQGTADYVNVTNNIVYSNGLVPGASGYGIREYGKTGTHNLYLNNLVYNNGPGNWLLQNGNTSSGTVTADPKFVNYQGDGSGDYHLKAGSPAIDAGTRQGAPAVDFQGGARPVGPAFDIGAYEWGSSPQSTSHEREGKQRASRVRRP